MVRDALDLNALPKVEAGVLPTPLPADKRAWRAWADGIARSRSPQARKQHAQVLTEEVLRLVAQLDAQIVGLYSPLGAEVETRDVAHALIVAGVQLAYPRVRPDGKAMDFAVSEGPAALQPRPRSRMMEPVGGVIPPEELDLLVIPAQAVRPDGLRLGRGGGYFDRYLPLLRAGAVTIAVCPAACAVAWEPVEAHDQALMLLCTEHGLAALG